MTVRPILFSGPMVRALLDGRKTQTRRVLRAPAPFDPSDDISVEVATGFVEPQYRRGDRLWVREGHYLTDDGTAGYAVYAENVSDVSAHLEEIEDLRTRHPLIDWSRHTRLRPSIHMPRWASRLTLTVTDVRVQRLWDISEKDAKAEGVPPPPEGIAPEWSHYDSYVDVFADVWDSLNADRAPWGSNPWVVALSFTVQRGNIDQAPACAS